MNSAGTKNAQVFSKNDLNSAIFEKSCGASELFV